MANATITPSYLEVKEGERAELNCNAGCHQIMWLLGDGTSDLPDGVSVKGSNLIIAAAQHIHNNTYVCIVANITGQRGTAANISVFYRPTANITSSQLTSPTRTLTFSHGDVDTPSFTCSADGNPPPDVLWKRSEGAPLPTGIVQQRMEGRQYLSWIRPLSYTDSGLYECVAANSEGEITASVEITVVFDRIIDTIFPAPIVRDASLASASAANLYYIPLEFTGVALTCMGFGWPTPLIRWTKDSGALPSGVTSVVTTKQGRVKANLYFTTPFSASFIGAYKCELAKAGSQEGRKVSQQVQLLQGNSQSGGKAKECQEITNNSILFQLRVLNTGCISQLSKGQAQIVEEFQNLLYRTFLSICNCDLGPDHISIIFMWCSKYKEESVVFRGSIQTNSSSLTGNIFCILYRWQMSGALVSVNDLLFVLDSRCSLKLDSNEAEECVESGPFSADQNYIILVLIISTLTICISVMLMFMSFFLYCYRLRRRRPAMKKGNIVQPNSTAVIHDSSDTHYHMDFPRSESPTEQVNSTYPCYEEPRCTLQQAGLLNHCYAVNIALQQATKTNDIYEEPNITVEQGSKPNIYEEPNVTVEQGSKPNIYEEPNVALQQATRTNDVNDEANVAVQQTGNGRDSQGSYSLPNAHLTVTVSAEDSTTIHYNLSESVMEASNSRKYPTS